MTGQGSLSIIARRAQLAGGAARTGWERWCSAGQARVDRQPLAYCARIDGLVVDTTRGPSEREVHAAVIGNFHLVIVRLKDGSPTPALGSRLVVVGPLIRARDGQREVQAFKVLHG